MIVGTRENDEIGDGDDGSGRRQGVERAYTEKEREQERERGAERESGRRKSEGAEETDGGRVEGGEERGGSTALVRLSLPAATATRARKLLGVVACLPDSASTTRAAKMMTIDDDDGDNVENDDGNDDHEADDEDDEDRRRSIENDDDDDDDDKDEEETWNRRQIHADGNDDDDDDEDDDDDDDDNENSGDESAVLGVAALTHRLTEPEVGDTGGTEDHGYDRRGPRERAEFSDERRRRDERQPFTSTSSSPFLRVTSLSLYLTPRLLSYAVSFNPDSMPGAFCISKVVRSLGEIVGSGRSINAVRPLPLSPFSSSFLSLSLFLLFPPFKSTFCFTLFVERASRFL